MTRRYGAGIESITIGDDDTPTLWESAPMVIDGGLVPPAFMARVTFRSDLPPLTLRISHSGAAAGAWGVSRIVADPDQLLTEDVLTALARILPEVVTEAVIEAARQHSTAVPETFARATQARVARRRGKPRANIDYLKAVAEAYRAGVERGAPRRAVKDKLDLSRQAADDLIRQCRDHALLPPAGEDWEQPELDIEDLPWPDEAP